MSENISEEECIDEMFDCVYFPRHPQKTPNLEPDIFSQRKLKFYVRTYIDEGYCAINIDGDRISRSTIYREFLQILKEIGDEHKDDEIRRRQFKEKVGSFKDGIKTKSHTGNFQEFECLFSLNISKPQALPDKFEVLGHNIQKKGSSVEGKGRDRIERIYDDDSISLHGRKRDVLSEELDKRWHSYWQINCEANDLLYALQTASEIVELLLAEINYAFQQYDFESRRELGFFYSYLKHPKFIVIESTDGFEHMYLHDVEDRLTEPIQWERADAHFDRLNHVPSFSLDYKKQETERQRLDYMFIQVLYLYQEAITSSSVYNAFSHFWRGIEVLTQVNDEQGTNIAVDRAEFLYKQARGEDDMSFLFREFLDELVDKRNKYMHEGFFVTTLTKTDYLYTKRLLERILGFCFENYDNIDSKEELRDYTRLGAAAPKLKNEINKFEEIANKVEGDE